MSSNINDVDNHDDDGDDQQQRPPCNDSHARSHRPFEVHRKRSARPTYGSCVYTDRTNGRSARDRKDEKREKVGVRWRRGGREKERRKEGEGARSRLSMFRDSTESSKERTTTSRIQSSPVVESGLKEKAYTAFASERRREREER